MDYYSEIKKELIDNEVYKKVKDYSKNKYELERYYNVGKLLVAAGNSYGDGVIKEYSTKLTKELDKKYSVRYLFDIRKLYLFLKVHPVGAQLTISHYRLLFPLSNDNEIKYYVNQVIERNLSKRQLETIIKSNEYRRLPEITRNKLAKKEQLNITDFIKHPIIIKNRYTTKDIIEKMLKQLILEDISTFMNELGDGYSFIDNEYKIKLGGRYNYIDILLFNIEFNCYVVVELKVTELKKEHIGQIQVYMKYIDDNIKKIYHNKTIGIIMSKYNNEFIVKYCYNDNIYETTYELV